MLRNFFTDSYAESIKRKWEIFQESGRADGVRDLIAESWMRCREKSVDVKKIRHEPMPPKEFKEILARNSKLVEVSDAILERIFYSVKSYNCLINLASADGIALSIRHGCGNVFKLLEGTRISEETIGTAGMPLCLKKKEPVIIYCAEHYCLPHHEIVCVSSPILAHDGGLLGGLTLSCHKDIFHPWSFMLITEAAISIAEQLRLRDMLDRETAMIESWPEGAILLDGAGRIIRASNMARIILGKAIGDGKNIHDIISDASLVERISAGRCFKNEETVIDGIRGAKRYIISFNPLESGGLLTLKNTPEMYSYAARTAGIEARYTFADITGQSASLREAIEVAEKYAPEEQNVLILGESGTGKELFAQAIHNASSRYARPFVVVNCGALPRELVQSELFGYAEGAFTGARKKGSPGKFELADGGTIFLDEIGEMELQAQVSLLRLLQSGEITRIGATTSRRVDVRVLAATNRDLPGAIAEGRFREDLYHRLNVFSLHIPPLRERSGDIPVLVEIILQRLAKRHPRFRKYSFTNGALLELSRRKWPGNVRELEHFLEKILFTSKNALIDIADLGEESLETREKSVNPLESDRDLISDALRQFNGDVGKAAKWLGLGRTTLYTKINILGLTPKQFKKLKKCSS